MFRGWNLRRIEMPLSSSSTSTSRISERAPESDKKAVSNYFIDEADSEEAQDDLGLNFNELA
jgi:hypothetical protein